MLTSFKNASVKSRLIVLSIIGMVGFSAILFGNFTFFKQSNEKLASLQSVNLKMVQIANELQVGQIDLNRLFEAAVLEMDKDTLAEALRLADEEIQQIESLREISGGLRDSITATGDAFKQYVEESKNYAESVMAGKLQGNDVYEAFASVLKMRENYDKSLRESTRSINAAFNDTLQSIRDNSQQVTERQLTFAAMLFLVFALAVVWFIRVITHTMDNVIGVAGQIADGNLDVSVDTNGSEEFQRLFGALDVMRLRLKQQHLENETRQKSQSQMAKLNEVLRGERTTQSLGESVLRCLADQMSVLVGVFYLLEDSQLVLKASYAYTRRKGVRNSFELGESLVGQAALEKQMLIVRDLPNDYTPVASGLGEAVPGEVVLLPLVLNGVLLGVVELMSFKPFTADELEFLNRGAEGMAISLHSAISRVELSKALDQTRQQAEALERQQEELRATNEELEEQAAVLRASEEHLQQQQEELRVMNEELEERNSMLDRQKEEIAQNNALLERSRKDLEEKAKQLELSGRYKSEFLSTMSHELRTPLNSILILSQGLMDNKKGNLEDKQIEHARVIHSSGRDLLLLINDILDLSKVEEGKLELLAENIEIEELTSKLQVQFEAQAESKGIGYIVSVSEDSPLNITVDEQRLTQILRNFLSNAFKFTHKGQIEFIIEPPKAPIKLSGNRTLTADNAIAFRVRDSGIGIPKDKQQLIFEAFQQVDGTISRKYGGTGLGLTISRKLADLMGGLIQVESAGDNQGSIFSLIIPRHMEGTKPKPTTVDKTEDAPRQDVAVSVPAPTSVSSTVSAKPSQEIANANPIESTGNNILIVEDDVEFARIIHSLAQEYGFSAVCVHTAADAYHYLEQNIPGSVILDLGLPDAPGQQFLSHLKSNARTEKIPVHVISGNPNVKIAELTGASEFIAKPFDRGRLEKLFHDIGRELSPDLQKSVLIIEDDPVQQEHLKNSFANKNISCDVANTGEEALQLLAKEKYGAIILDLDLPDCNGFELLEKIGSNKDEHSHIIIYTARDITKKQDADLRRFADRIVLKTDKSITRLLNETSLFLHWLQGEGKRADAAPPPVMDDDLKGGKHILLVDDDIRNVYSLSSVLEDVGMEITTASTGKEALDALQKNPEVDLILMDIMMPEMDGFEAMKRIRAEERFRNIPIIALTAKAMRDDRARCIEAGANDYMSKPVDTSKLKAVIKLWLQQ